MKKALLVMALAVGCGDASSTTVEYPEKPTCEHDAAVALMTCPEGFEWVTHWRRPSTNNPEVIESGYFPTGEEPGEPWAMAGEECVEAGSTPSGSNTHAGWGCRESVCTYRYGGEQDSDITQRRVTCNLENGSVGLDITTTRAGEEPVTEYWRWYLGAETPEKLDL